MDTHLQTISLLRPLVLSRGGHIIDPGSPVWQTSPPPAKNPDDTGHDPRSRLSRPGAAVHVPGQAALRIELWLPEGAAGTYRLEGVYGGDFVLFAGAIELSQPGPEITIDVSLTASPVLTHDEPPVGWLPVVSRPVTWKLYHDGDDEPVMAEATGLELYWLIRDPSRWFQQGIPVEFLRQLTDGLNGNRNTDITCDGDRVGLGLDQPQPSWSVARTVQWLFRRNPPRYDITAGGNYFTELTYPDFNQVVLLLGRYLAAHEDVHAICNCYDMAALLQASLRMLGLWDTAYCFMKPFGYLREDGLVGRGSTNNPFCDKNLPTPEVAPETAEWRTAFSNHAFCYLPPRTAVAPAPPASPASIAATPVTPSSSGTIADACTGSHPGNQSPEQYVATAVDDLIPPGRAGQQGNVSNIELFRGVVAVNTVQSHPISRQLPEVEQLCDAISHHEAMKKRSGDRRVIARWPGPLDCPDIDESRWDIVFAEQLIGSRECNQHWRLRHDQETVVLDIYVASGDRCAATAEDRFLHLTSVNTLEHPIVGPGPSWLGHSSAIHENASQACYVWLFHNVVFRVRTRGMTLDCEAVAHWLQDIAAGSLFDVWTPEDSGGAASDPQAPDITGLQISHLRPAVGTRFTVSIDPGPGYRLHVHHRHPGIRCVGNQDCDLRFEALEPSSGELEIIAVDPATLITSTRTVTIDVVP